MKTFFQQLLATVAGMFLFAVLAGAFLFVLAFLILFSSEVPHSHPRGAFLTLDLSQPITDRGELPRSLGMLGVAATPLKLADVVDALHDAADDETIGGLFLHGSPELSWGMLRELREAVLEFRDAGKPVVAFCDDPDEHVLYLASAADDASVAPLAVASLDGLAAQVIYFGDALRKLGVQVQVTRVGKFKSAVEPFVASEMSPENREQLAVLLEGLFGTFLSETGAGLDIEPSKLMQLCAERPFLSAEESVQLGLFDQVASFDKVLDRLRERAGPSRDGSTFAQVSVREYAAQFQGPEFDGAGSPIAVVYAEGDIVDGDDEQEVGGSTLARELRALRHDEDVRAVVLRVNSPGGSASASEEIYDEVKRLREAGKVVVVSMGGVAASGGYWISCDADAILAEPNTITGSIGVFGLWPNAQELMHDLGLSAQVVKTSPYADARSLFRSKSPEELALAQRHVDAIYEDFIARVARGRNLPADRVRDNAQGRVFTGAQAKTLGLVDDLGGLSDAIELAASRADLGKDWTVRYPVLVKRPMDELLELMVAPGGEAPLAQLAALPAELRRLAASAAGFVRASARGGVFARLPFELSVR